MIPAEPVLLRRLSILTPVTDWMQQSLRDWQRLLHSAEASIHSRAAWAACQQLHQNQQHALIVYHKQQAARMQHKYLAGQCNALTHIRHHYHSGEAH